MYNLKNRNGQQKFKEITSTGTFLSEVFDNNDDLNKSTALFLKRLNQVIKKSFNKIRITDKPDKELDALYAKRKEIKNKADDKRRLALEEIEIKLADKCAERNYNLIKEEILNIQVEEHGVHSGSLWRLKKKLSPKCRDPPTAMLDSEGILHTSPEEIEKIALKTYENRLQNRPMKD